MSLRTPPGRFSRTGPCTTPPGVGTAGPAPTDTSRPSPAQELEGTPPAAPKTAGRGRPAHHPIPTTTGLGPHRLVSRSSVTHNRGVRLRWAKSSRNHRVGRASATHVITHHQPTPLDPVQPHQQPRRWWRGVDERGRELDVIAAELPDGTLLVTHVFPVALSPSRKAPT